MSQPIIAELKKTTNKQTKHIVNCANWIKSKMDLMLASSMSKIVIYGEWWAFWSTFLTVQGHTLICQWPVKWQKLDPFLNKCADVANLYYNGFTLKLYENISSLCRKKVAFILVFGVVFTLKYLKDLCLSYKPTGRSESYCPLKDKHPASESVKLSGCISRMSHTAKACLQK